MKVIDLLNLVYNKKAPKKILYKYCEYKFNEEINDYQNKDSLELFSYLFSNKEQALFLEVEIIEEVEKYRVSTQTASYDIERYNDAIDTINKNIGELTKAVNHLLKKESK